MQRVIVPTMTQRLKAIAERKVSVRCYFAGRRHDELESVPVVNIMTPYLGEAKTLAEARQAAYVAAKDDGWVVTSLRHVVPA